MGENGHIVNTTYRLNVHQGIPFGYFKGETNTKITNKKFEDEVLELEKNSGENRRRSTQFKFQFGDRVVVFDGLGLQANDSLIQNNAAMPTRTIGPEQPKYIYIITDNKEEVLQLVESPCSLEQTKFPDCNRGSYVYYFQHYVINSSERMPRDTPKIYCQNPRQIASCSSFQGLKDIVNDVEAFIGLTLTQIKVEFKRTHDDVIS